MKTITKYIADDGSEHGDADSALHRDALVRKVADAMQPLGDVPQDVQHGKGWLHHDLELVYQAKDRILDICREEGWANHFPVFNQRGRNCHPGCVIGLVLNGSGGPLDKAWSRFYRIDEQGREHQQGYYAYTAGPAPDHVCVEDRRGQYTAPL